MNYDKRAFIFDAISSVDSRKPHEGIPAFRLMSKRRESVHPPYMPYTGNHHHISPHRHEHVVIPVSFEPHCRGSFTGIQRM